ncbi:hypothetical protein BaRGS_00012429 [Batillaria attramentaria]|uniref:Uncharacterized protein n=1 Tax=Batillaria attramentaria TaxID=370345 RepID=A0ABD0LA18_9CAEN
MGSLRSEIFCGVPLNPVQHRTTKLAEGGINSQINSFINAPVYRLMTPPHTSNDGAEPVCVDVSTARRMGKQRRVAGSVHPHLVRPLTCEGPG